jgi:hypothetical protein
MPISIVPTNPDDSPKNFFPNNPSRRNPRRGSKGIKMIYKLSGIMCIV